MSMDVMGVRNGLLWFGGPQCNVCQAMRPKVRAMIEETFPELTFVYIDVSEHAEIAARHQVFTLPVAIAKLDGREYFRWVRAFGVDQIREQLTRPYEMLFGDAD